MPLALIGMLALGLAVRGRGDRRTAGLFVLGGWFLVELATLDFSAGIVHPYYASALGPGLAAMVGAGAVAIASLVRNRKSRQALRGYLLAVAAVAGTVAVQLVLIDREGDPLWWRIPLVVLCLGRPDRDPARAPARRLGRRRRGGRAARRADGLQLQRLAGAGRRHLPGSRALQLPGPGRLRDWSHEPADQSITDPLPAHARRDQPYALLTQSSDQASPLILLGLGPRRWAATTRPTRR